MPKSLMLKQAYICRKQFIYTITQYHSFTIIFLSESSGRSMMPIINFFFLFSELQRKKFSSAVSDKADTVAVNDEEPSEENPEQVYGIVKTHAPPQAPQVRDPTKEILSGLWRSTSSRSLPSQMSQTQNSPASSFHHTGGKKHFQPYFGRIRTHSPSSNQIGQSSEPISKLELLRNELYGGSRPDKSSQQSEVYGTVHHRFNPNAAGDSSSLDSKLDLVRSILAKEEGTEVNEESKNAFDRIRDKLLNSRNHRVRPPKERNLRRKGSKKRRRNVSIVLLHTLIYILNRVCKNFRPQPHAHCTYFSARVQMCEIATDLAHLYFRTHISARDALKQYCKNHE